MHKFILTAVVILFGHLASANATEITACISDTSVKKNPGLVYFPVAQTVMRCDFRTKGATLSALYQQNWRVIQIVSPVLINQKKGKSGYSPTVVYMERAIAPAAPLSDKVSTAPPSDIDSTKPESDEENKAPRSGGLFDWLKGDKGGAPIKPEFE